MPEAVVHDLLWFGYAVVENGGRVRIIIIIINLDSRFFVLDGTEKTKWTRLYVDCYVRLRL